MLELCALKKKRIKTRVKRESDVGMLVTGMKSTEKSCNWSLAQKEMKQAV